MRRLLLDTNIYGLIVERGEEEEFKVLVSKASAVVYGCSAVRKELRDTPKGRRKVTDHGTRNYRILLLQIYDDVIMNREIAIDEKTQELANKYLKRFSEITGKSVLDHLKIDFLLVASATLNKLDLIVSDDHKTLLSLDSMRAYNLVNELENLKTPILFPYKDAKVFLKRLSLL